MGEGGRVGCSGECGRESKSEEGGGVVVCGQDESAGEGGCGCYVEDRARAVVIVVRLW